MSDEVVGGRKEERTRTVRGNGYNDDPAARLVGRKIVIELTDGLKINVTLLAVGRYHVIIKKNDYDTIVYKHAIISISYRDGE